MCPYIFHYYSPTNSNVGNISKDFVTLRHLLREREREREQGASNRTSSTPMDQAILFMFLSLFRESRKLIL